MKNGGLHAIKPGTRLPSPKIMFEKIKEEKDQATDLKTIQLLYKLVKTCFFFLYLRNKTFETIASEIVNK